MLEHLKYWRSVKYWSIVKHINNVLFSLCGSPYDLAQAKKLNQGPTYITANSHLVPDENSILVLTAFLEFTAIYTKLVFCIVPNLSFGHECRAKLHTMQTKLLEG